MLSLIIYTGAVAVVLIYLFNLVFKYSLTTLSTSAPTYPNPFPYVGTSFLRSYAAAWASNDRGAWMQDLLSNPGLTTVAYVWGTPWFFTAHPDNIRQILTDSASKVAVEPTRRPHSGSYIGDGMFVSDGERWRLSRALFKPMFSRPSVSKFQRLEKHVQKFIETLPADGTSIDLQPAFKRLYLDISTETLFGVSVDSQKAGDARIDVTMFEKKWQAAMFGMLKKITSNWTTRLFEDDAEWKKDYTYVHEVFDRLIDETMERKHQGPKMQSDGQKDQNEGEEESMLEKILQQSEERKFLRDQLLNVSLGAKDTAGIGISDVFFHLARHPTVYQRIRDEALSIKSQQITFELLKSMKYLQAVLAESLRLLSPVTTAIRNTTAPITLPRGGGPSGESAVVVPKGSRLEISISALHKSRDFWGVDAADFSPERWLNPRKQRSDDNNASDWSTSKNRIQTFEELERGDEPSGVGKPWQYVPFLGGARICPAQQMMLTQYAYIVVRFCQTFQRLENRDPEDFVGEIIFSLQSRNGVQVALYK